MGRDRIALQFGLRLAAGAIALAAPAALARAHGGAAALAAAPATTPEPVLTEGPDGPDPDPGATGAWAGRSESQFYDVGGRIAAVRRRIAETLSGSRAAEASRSLDAIEAEERSQVARHGTLLDWARENLSHRLDLLVAAYPSLYS